MRDFIDKLVSAAEALLEAVDDDTIKAFEQDRPLSDQPQHSPHYYLALQDLRNIVRKYRAFMERK